MRSALIPVVRSRYESSQTTVRREAEALLRDRELREERRKMGLELAECSSMKLGKAVTEFLDETQVFDRAVPERNRKVMHPILGREVRGTAWWCRTVEFAAMALVHFGDCDVKVLAESGRIAGFERWMTNKGGARGEGLGRSSRHKVLTWLARFSRWCVVRSYLREDPFAKFEIPAERVEKRDRILDDGEIAKFWAEYEALPLKAKVRIGLVLWTGARAGEVETIRVADVSSSFGTVRRRLWKRSRGDGPNEVVVKVPAELMTLIDAWVKEEELGQDDRLLPIRCHAGRRFLRRWATSLRGLRRTVLTRLQNAGVPLRVIQEAAGHSKLDTTQRYLGVGEGAVNAALSSLNWGESGANQSANSARHHTTTDRELARHDRETCCTEDDCLIEAKSGSCRSVVGELKV